MIIVYHQNNKITSVWDYKNSKSISCVSKTISDGLLELSKTFSNALLIWCNKSLTDVLNIDELDKIFHHKNMLVSYRISKKPYLTDAIGYVTETPFININKSVEYPTWLMSSDVGGINTSVLLKLESQLFFDSNFDYFLNSLARLCMPLGLFCYSSPKLLKRHVKVETKKVDSFTLFKFVKQHYKAVWVYLLFINFVLHEKKTPLLALIRSLFYSRRIVSFTDFNALNDESLNKKNIENLEVDVVIPTIGRKKYLYDTLKDLTHQTLLPKNIIIVEQNPDTKTKTELDYLNNETWPFKINHHFTHKTGACNARNIALNTVNSDWVFLADDDIVLENNFIEKASHTVNQLGYNAFTFSCYLKNEIPTFKFVKQWENFGSGCSFVKTEVLKDIKFSKAFEYGFGEDADFGMQLRNKGVDVVYLPEPSILHLKAPIGGFRVKPELAWKDDDIQPKPSPTVMLYLIKHQSKKQILGYKTTLFLKYYKHQNISNPFKYYQVFKKQWNRSQFWANCLNQQDN